MALFKSDAVVAGICPDFSQAGVVLCRSAKYVTVDDEIVSGDTLQMVPIPEGAKILRVDVYYSTLPAGTTGCDVGYGGDADAYLATVPMTGDNMQSWPSSTYRNKAVGVSRFLETFTAADTIDIAFTKLATKIPTSQAIYMAVQYVMVGSISDET